MSKLVRVLDVLPKEVRDPRAQCDCCGVYGLFSALSERDGIISCDSEYDCVRRECMKMGTPPTAMGPRKN